MTYRLDLPTVFPLLSSSIAVSTGFVMTIHNRLAKVSGNKIFHFDAEVLHQTWFDRSVSLE